MVSASNNGGCRIICLNPDINYYPKKLRLTACGNLPSERINGSQFALVSNQVRISNLAVMGSSNIEITLSNAVVEVGEGADEAQVKFTLEVFLNAQ